MASPSTGAPALGLALAPAAAHLLLGPLLPPAWVPASLVVLLLLAALGRSPPALLRYTVCACLLPPLHSAARRALALRPSPGLGLSWPLLLAAHAASALPLLTVEGLLPAVVRTPTPRSSPSAQTPAAPAIIPRLLELSRRDLWPLVGAFTFLILAVLGGMFLPYYTGVVIDMLGSLHNYRHFLSAIIFMSVTSLGSSVSAGVRGGLFMFTMSRFNRRIRTQLFTSLVKQEIAFFDETKTGDITSRLSNDTSLTSRSIAANVNIFLRTLVNVVGVLCFAFALSRQLTIVMFVESPLTILVQKLYNQYYLKQVQEVQDSIGRSNQLAGEIVSSMRTVRSFATEDWESERFNKKLQETGQLRNKRDLIRAVYLLCHRHLQLLMEVVILYYGQYLVRTGQMTTGNLVAFFLYQTNYRNHVQTLVHMCSDMSLSMGAAERVFEYLDRKPAIRCDGTLVPEILTGHLEFKNVSFSYPMRPHTQVLKDVSFEVRSGEMTALVGVTGGGKTTCVSLLQRFYEPQSGRILLDGHPIEEYQHQYYHRKVSLVSQEPVLFAGSVRDNIRYGLESCLHSAVTEAAEKADAREFIEAMDQGYDTDVGESGAQISVGEKQRIAIARALVRQPQLLVLDEATSSLDVQTELTIQRALSKGAQTTLVIAHRLKTVEQADKIIVMEGGRVVEQGTHQQLMEKGGCYNRMVQLLFSDRE